MKMNKIMLMSLALAMPFAMTAKSMLPDLKDVIVDNKDMLKQGALDLAAILVIQKAVESVGAPIAGLIKGCERRTMIDMEKSLKQDMTPEQYADFERKHIQEKIDTKIATTATGPLFAVAATGVYVAWSTLNPVGIVVAGIATLANTGALMWAEKAQAHNNQTYKSALAFVNNQRLLAREGQLVGHKGLSDLQKMLCKAGNL